MRSINKIITLLKDDHWKNRAEATTELGNISGSEFIFYLIDTLKDEEPDVAQQAVDGLIKIGSPAILPLINALSDEDWKVSDRAAMALAKIGKPAVEPLIKSIRDNANTFFLKSIMILGDIGDKNAVPVLISLIEEGDYYIIKYAIEALGKIGDKRATIPIINSLKRYGSSYEGIIALGELGDPDSIPTLLDELLKDYKWAAAKSLGKIGKSAVKPLVEFKKNEIKNVQDIICEALGYTRDKGAIIPLITALRDEDSIISWRAARALTRIGTAAVDALIQVLTEGAKKTRILAIESLGKIGDSRATKPLETIIKNEADEEVRCSAMEALKRTNKVLGNTIKYKKIVEKDVFQLHLGFSERYFRAELAHDILTQEDIDDLVRGELNTPIPLPYRYSGGKKQPEDFIFTGLMGFIISDRIKNLFLANNFTGWKTYPINLYDKSGNLISGYHGFAVKGKVGEMDHTRCRIDIKPSLAGLKPEIVKIGLYFDENSWDGSDFFMPHNTYHTLATRRVIEALQKIHPRAKNYEATPSLEYDWPISKYDFNDPLTEKQRNAVNELRKALKKEYQQDMQITTRLIEQGKMVDEDEFSHLLKSVVRNQCMYTDLSNQDVCQGIIKSFTDAGQTQITGLIDALRNQEGDIRSGAAWVLGKLKVKEAVEPLLQAIKDEDENVRRESIMALGGIGDSKAVTPLIEVLEGEDTVYVRCGATAALGAICDTRTVQSLIFLINNEEEVLLLCEVASALGKFGDPQAVFPLIELFENEDSNLAEHIKWALADIGQQAVLPLIQALRHNHPLVRRGAARTLGEMGEKDAVLPLINHLSVEEDPEVLSFIVEALGQLGDQRAIKPILKIAQNTTIEYLHKEIKITLQKILKTK